MYQSLFRHLASALLTLGLTVVLARYLGSTDYGRYALAVLIPSLLNTVFNFGIGSGNVYFVGQRRASLTQAWRTSLLFAIVLSLLGLGTAAAVIVFGAGVWLDGVPHKFLWLAVLAFPPLLIATYASSLLQAQEEFSSLNRTLLVAPVVTLLASLLGFWVAGPRTDVAIGAFVLGQCTQATATWISLKVVSASAAPIAARADSKYAKSLLSYGWRAHASNVLTFFNYRADIFILNFFLAPASAGIYMVAVLLAERLWMLSQAVSTVLLPRLSRLDQTDAAKAALTPIVSRWVFIISALAALVLGLATPVLIQVLFGSQYSGVTGALLWLLPGVVLGSMSRVLANDLSARGRPELNLYTAMVMVTINITANVALIPLLGIIGAAISSTIAYSLNAGVKLFLYVRLTDTPWHRPLFPSRADWRALTAKDRGKGPTRPTTV